MTGQGFPGRRVDSGCDCTARVLQCCVPTRQVGLSCVVWQPATLLPIAGCHCTSGIFQGVRYIKVPDLILHVSIAAGAGCSMRCCFVDVPFTSSVCLLMSWYLQLTAGVVTLGPATGLCCDTQVYPCRVYPAGCTCSTAVLAADNTGYS